jgi:hypothetical protein
MGGGLRCGGSKTDHRGKGNSHSFNTNAVYVGMLFYGSACIINFVVVLMDSFDVIVREETVSITGIVKNAMPSTF